MTRVDGTAYWDGVAPIPKTLPDILDRMVQVQYASRIALDRKFFAKIDHVVDLVQQVDHLVPPDIRQDPEYQRLLSHRKINHFHVVTANFAPGLANASDFSPASVEARIEAGYRDAITQGIGDAHGANTGRAVAMPS
jgi:NTE family protein